MVFPLTRRLAAAVLLVLALFWVPSRAQAQPTREELTIYVNEVTTWSPGYAMGDIVLGRAGDGGLRAGGGPQTADAAWQEGRSHDAGRVGPAQGAAPRDHADRDHA